MVLKILMGITAVLYVSLVLFIGAIMVYASVTDMD